MRSNLPNFGIEAWSAANVSNFENRIKVLNHSTLLASLQWSLSTDHYALQTHSEMNKIWLTSRAYRSKFCSVCIIIFWRGGWVWLPPVPFSYVNWADGEPNNWSEQDCVQILPVWAHKWDDDFCNYHKKAVCEKNGEMVLQQQML